MTYIFFFKDFNFFGLQNGDQCICGDDDSNIIPANSFECNIRCSGDEEQFCGGSWRVNIYSTAKNCKRQFEKKDSKQKSRFKHSSRICKSFLKYLIITSKSV